MQLTQAKGKGRLVAVACVAALAGMAACGDDDDSNGASAEVSSAFCEAKAELDAVSPDTPDEAALRRYQAEAEPILDRLAAEAPDELGDAVAIVVESISEPATLEEAGAAATDERVSDAREQIGVAVHEACGFDPVEFVVVDHEFEAAPDTISSGTASVLLDNRGDALHAVVLFRANDDVPDTEVEGLIGSEELETRATFVNAMPADGGHKAQLVVDLAPGRYLYFDDEHIDGMHGTFIVE